MLIKAATLRGIKDGSVTLAFRRWRRPTVKAGSTLLTSIGQLAIEDVAVVDLDSITASEARQAGFEDLHTLQALLAKRVSGDVYRVRLSWMGPDPRITLRERIAEGPELEDLLARLAALDRRSTSGPWTRLVLQSIERRPAELAAELAGEVGIPRDRFKSDVRKLKALGLTESLEVGYRLSPRGRAVLTQIP